MSHNINQPLLAQPTLTHEPPLGAVAPVVMEIMGDGLRRLFVIWNRGYKTICVVAMDQHEALHIAVACKHIKRAGQYRRFDDLTDKVLAGHEVEGVGLIEDAERILNLGRSGHLTRGDDGVLTIGGCSTAENK